MLTRRRGLPETPHSDPSQATSYGRENITVSRRVVYSDNRKPGAFLYRIEGPLGPVEAAPDRIRLLAANPVGALSAVAERLANSSDYHDRFIRSSGSGSSDAAPFFF